MDRDWDAEWARVQAEFYAAERMRDAARRPAVPWPMNTASEIVRLADRRFDAAEARRDAFVAERKRSGPAWSEID